MNNPITITPRTAKRAEQAWWAWVFNGTGTELLGSGMEGWQGNAFNIGTSPIKSFLSSTIMSGGNSKYELSQFGLDLLYSAGWAVVGLAASAIDNAYFNDVASNTAENGVDGEMQMNNEKLPERLKISRVQNDGPRCFGASTEAAAKYSDPNFNLDKYQINLLDPTHGDLPMLKHDAEIIWERAGVSYHKIDNITIDDIKFYIDRGRPIFVGIMEHWWSDTGHAVLIDGVNKSFWGGYSLTITNPNSSWLSRQEINVNEIIQQVGYVLYK